MRKFLTIAIPIVTIAFFVCIMLSGGFLKQPLGKNDDIPQHIENLVQNVNEEAWDEVGTEVEDFEQAWKTVSFRVQFSSELDEINSLSENISRLRGAALAQDKAGALMELYEAQYHWEQLDR